MIIDYGCRRKEAGGGLTRRLLRLVILQQSLVCLTTDQLVSEFRVEQIHRVTAVDWKEITSVMNTSHTHPPYIKAETTT